MNYAWLLQLAAPESLTVLTALLVLGADLLALGGLGLRQRRLLGALLASVGCLGAIGLIVLLPQQGNWAGGMLVIDPLSQLLKSALLLLSLLTVWLSVDTDFTPHVGEYIALLLLGTVGMMVLISTEELLLLFVSLELTSLSLYLLTGFDKRSPRSAEAALKYFLFGGMSAAFTLFGLSLLYGLSGSTNLLQVGLALQGPKLEPLLLLALVMTVAGLGFKVAVAPFHLWAPDTYQGAPAPSAGFIASGSKVAGFFVLAKVLLLGFGGAAGALDWRGNQPGWVPLVGVLAVASMVLGNLGALAQSSVRRLLAYSAIAHGGYLLLGILAQDTQGVAALLYYVLTYAVSALGAFGVVALVQQQSGGESLADFAGLSRRAPLLALSMLVFLLSLAGIPPLAGFFAKFYLFAALLRAGPGALSQLWLVSLAIGMSAVSLYYYLQVLKQIYVVQGPVQPPQPQQRPARLTQGLCLLLAGALLLLGSMPEPLLACLRRAISLTALQR